MKRLEKYNIYAIPVGDEFSNESTACYLVYAPLANIFFLALPQEVENIITAIESKEENDVVKALMNGVSLRQRNLYANDYSSSSTLYLLLNEKCNFHCRYCYSAEGRSKDEMSLGQMKTALEYFLSAGRNAPESRTVMFIGGGEPTLSWELVKQGTEYAESLALQNGIKLMMRLSTNGSILNDEMVAFYKKHHFQIQYSFEVLKDVQEYQRGSFDAVDKNLKRLLLEGIHCNTRSTITIENVDRIEEMVEFCHLHYPAIDRLICEPVVDPDYFSSVALVDEYQKRYFESFKKGLYLAMKYGLPLSSSNYGSIRQLRERFCYNLLCVTPFGTLTTCPNVSSPREKNYEQVIVGNIKNNRIVFDDEAYRRMTVPYIHTDEKCKGCWAKWNCGGGCPNQRMVYRNEIFDAICLHNKQMLKHYLLLELGVKHTKRTGRDMYVDITQKLKER